MITNLRQVLRSLRRAPWYSGSIIGVMALGMALATTVFAVVDGVLFKPIGLPDSNQLFTVLPRIKAVAPAPDRSLVSKADLDSWAEAASDTGFTGFWAQAWSGFGAGVNAYDAGVARVLPNVFEVLGVRPMIGGFEPADFDHDAPTLPVIVTNDVWQGRFQGDPKLLGRVVELNPVSHFGFRVVGVMPRGFVFPSERTDVKFITPLVSAKSAGDQRSQDSRRVLDVVARLPAGVRAEALRARIETVMAATAAAFPQGPKPAGWSDAGWRREGPYDEAEIVPLSVALGSRSRPLFSAVFCAVVVLIGIGGLNVAGLMAARTTDRAREIGARLAMGASRASIARLIFLEALVLIAAGSLVGLAVALPLLRLTLSLLPDEMVLLKPATVDWRVVAFTVGTAVTLAVPTALWPIRRAMGLKAARGLRAGSASPRTRSASRFFFVAGQIAGGFVLTLGGTLLVGSLLAVYSNDVPVRTRGVFLVESLLQGPGATMGKSPERNSRVGPLLDRLRQVPGVGAVAMTSAQVLRGGSWGSWFTPPEGARKLDDIDIQGVTAGYYRLMQPQLIAGRLPTDDELAHDDRVLVVSQRVAEAYWPAGSALGHTLVEEGQPERYTVIGVVKDVRWYSWDVETASIYGPFVHLSRAPFLTFLIEGRSTQVMADVVRALDGTSPPVKSTRAAMLDDVFVDSVRTRRFQAWLFGSFATAGLAILGVGILGLLAMTTARRVKEIGIRTALGATSAGLVGLLMREQLAPVVVGLTAGGIVSASVMTLLEKYLYRITAGDPRVWAAAAFLIVTTAAIGALVPALRASRIDPVQALRAE